jgi:phosphatidylglycerophosphate synthase
MTLSIVRFVPTFFRRAGSFAIKLGRDATIIAIMLALFVVGSVVFILLPGLFVEWVNSVLPPAGQMWFLLALLVLAAFLDWLDLTAPRFPRAKPAH